MKLPGIGVNWLATVEHGTTGTFQVRMNRLLENQVVVICDYQLMPGSHCRLGLRLPGSGGTGKPNVVQGKCQVLETVLSGMGFRSALKWLEIEDGSEAMLWNHARRDYVEQA